MTWGLGTSSWASSTSLEFVPAPPVEMGGGGGGGGGRGEADNKRKMFCFIYLAWLGVLS